MDANTVEELSPERRHRLKAILDRYRRRRSAFGKEAADQDLKLQMAEYSVSEDELLTVSWYYQK